MSGFRSRGVDYRSKCIGQLEPSSIEPFSGGMVVALAGRWGWWWTGRRIGNPGFWNQSAAAVVELEIAGEVGVALHGELATVMGVVVMRTQSGQILGISSAPANEGMNVMNFQVCGRTAPRVPASAVAVENHPARVRGHDVHRSADVDRLSLGEPQRSEDAVTQQHVAHGLWQRGPGIEPRAGRPTIVLGVEMPVDAEAVAPRSTSDRANRPVAHLDQRLDPGDIRIPGKEERVPSFLDGRFDERAVMGRCLDVQCEPAQLLV